MTDKQTSAKEKTWACVEEEEIVLTHLTKDRCVKIRLDKNQAQKLRDDLNVSIALAIQNIIGRLESEAN